MFSRGTSGCLALKVKHGWHFPMCSFTWGAIRDQKNLSCIRSSMWSRPKCPTLSWHPLRATSLCAVGRTNCRRVPSDSLGLAHLYKTPFVVPDCSAPSCTDSIWGSLTSWTGPVLASPLLVSLLLCLRQGPLLAPAASHQGSFGLLADCPGLPLQHASHSCKPLWGKQSI